MQEEPLNSSILNLTQIGAHPDFFSLDGMKAGLGRKDSQGKVHKRGGRGSQGICGDTCTVPTRKCCYIVAICYQAA